MKKYNNMKPMNVGGPVLIPYADNGNTVGSFGWMRKELDRAQGSKHRFNSKISSYPNFKPGYSFKGFGDNWQSYDNITMNDCRILESLTVKYGADTLLKEMNLKQAAAAGLIGAGLLGGMTSLKNNIETNVPVETVTEPIHNTNNFDKKVNAVNEIIERVFKLNKIPMSELRISPEWLVMCAEAENFDLPLMLAQLQWESCFGTSPRAKRTNSPFSIGCYDSGKNVARYKTQDDSVMPYIRTIQDEYMMNGKFDVDDLLSDDNFVNFRGDRYSSSRDYEENVRNTRADIMRKYPFLNR